MISVIIPAYNEEKRIANAIRLALTVADQIIVVADGTDQTADCVKKWQKIDDRIILMELPFRMGKGAAFLKAVEEAATGDEVFLVDADFPVPPKYLRSFSDLLQNFDCVIGSRYSKDSLVFDFPFKRRLLSRGYRMFANLFFDLGLSDYQCGFKAFRKIAIMKVIRQMENGGYAFDVELLLRLRQAGCTIRECAVEWHHGKGSKVGWKQIPEMFYALLKLKFKLSFKESSIL